MNTFKLWKKLNGLVKTKDPMQAARKMLEDGSITTDEAAWALSALATLPLTMIEFMEKSES